jgi:toluene monooxygenase system ferredoxin subunit
VSVDGAETAAFTALCAADDLWAGEMLELRIGPHRVVLLNVEGELHAYEGVCPHQGVALAEGDFDGRTLVCRAHHWEFDACSGRSVNPKGECLRRYPVKIVDGQVLVGDAPAT